VDTFNFTNNRLIEKGFKPTESQEIEDLGAVTYRSSINHVVLKKIHTHEELEDIRAYSTDIRNIILNEKLNVNNTYLLFCINEEIDYETFYLIERDTRALRKYVIRNERDLNRIPFLDNIKENENANINIEKEEGKEVEDNYYLLKIFEYLTENTGQHNKLSTEQIEGSVKKIIDLAEKRYEN